MGCLEKKRFRASYPVASQRMFRFSGRYRWGISKSSKIGSERAKIVKIKCKLVAYKARDQRRGNYILITSRHEAMIRPTHSAY